MAYQILQGDSRVVLATLPERSVHVCVTSPPYWGLRDYGTAQWQGGDTAHEHVGNQVRNAAGGDGKQYTNAGSGSIEVRTGDCACGARRSDAQIGLEQTPDEYVSQMVAVFREVRRVLRDDGTLWLNLGDSYANAQSSGQNDFSSSTLTGGHGARDPLNQGHRKEMPADVKIKDLVGIPWSVAFALRADGWYLRSDIIWHKPNPMPESVTDRPTKSHEYLFLLAKSDQYFYDADAIAEPALNAGRVLDYTGDQKANDVDPVLQNTHPRGRKITVRDTRNKRSVWTVSSHAFHGAHFATFPPKLILPCILAGSPPGGTVLDPFSGAGTTGIVACRRNRHYIGIELNPEYVEMSRNRIHDDDPMFNVEVDEPAKVAEEERQIKLLE